MTDGERLAPSLLALWETYLRHGRHQLQARGELAAVNQMLAPGMGVADLIIGSTLIDVKVASDPASDLPDWLDQLLHYVLLDADDHYRLEHIGIYEAWRGKLLTVPIHAAAGISDPAHLAALSPGLPHRTPRPHRTPSPLVRPKVGISSPNRSSGELR